MASSKKPTTGDWKAFSAWVTGLTEKQALAELRTEAQCESPRPYVLKRLYHRWRQAQVRVDMARIETGKLPEYLEQRT